MAKGNQQNGALAVSDSQSLTPEQLNNIIISQIEQFGKNVFRSLQEVGTESLLVYLSTISIDSVVRAYLDNPASTQQLIKTIWPTEHAIVERYLDNDKLSLDPLAVSVQTLLEADEFGARIFETLLIFTGVVPLMEEHLQEWVLLQFRRELRAWHRRGRFQRLDISIPSEQRLPPEMSRGDLQIQVSASKPTIVAGQEFSVFVVIGNPFDVPIVLYSVETQIPVELVDVAGRQLRRASLAEEPPFKRSQSGLWNNILHLTWDRWRMNLRMAIEPENRIVEAIAAPEAVDRRKQLALTVTQSIESVGADSKVIGASISRYQTVDVEIDSASPKHLDNLFWRIEAFKKGVIPIVLQPGDSVVKQFIFRTKSWLLFTPLAHTLQIQVRYGVDDRDHLDTVQYELTIQAAITATMAGAVIGGAVGGIARLLSEVQAGTVNISAQILSLLLAVILSAITVVSFARKSGVQQIVSIEDFWGGLFLGFLIGFLGQNFALDLITPQSTGGAISTPSP